ncbi:MAG TPA: glycerol-3-phosphate acyltransferase [Acidimicrobiales bacterium]|nr:glycerol-3-phosphate acyltransferase [Acidimicrobiales bacterium]
MAPPATLLFALGGYLVGNFPTAVLVARSRGHDVAHEGSGNPGATNVYRIAGRKAGAVVFGGDLAKGALVTGIALALSGRDAALAGGAASVVGHCFPVTRRFRGGKGVATAAGFSMVIEPILVLAAAVVWAVTVKAVGRASVGSLVVAIGFPVAVLLWRGPHAETAVVAGVAALVVARHAQNISRLLRGEESTLRGSSKEQ